LFAEKGQGFNVERQMIPPNEQNQTEHILSQITSCGVNSPSLHHNGIQAIGSSVFNLGDQKDLLL
jgi:hypothetical protein